MYNLRQTLIIIGICHLIYSFIFRNQAAWFFRLTTKKLEILHEKEFFKLQFYFSILNSIVMIGCGLGFMLLNLSDAYAVLLPLMFHWINYQLKITSKMKGYITY